MDSVPPGTCGESAGRVIRCTYRPDATNIWSWMPGPELTELAEAAAARVASELGPDKATSVDQRFDHNPPEQLGGQSAGGTSTQGTGRHAREGAASNQLDDSNQAASSSISTEPTSTSNSRHSGTATGAPRASPQSPSATRTAAATRGLSNGNSGNSQQLVGMKGGPTSEPKDQGGTQDQGRGE